MQNGCVIVALVIAVGTAGCREGTSPTEDCRLTRLSLEWSPWLDEVPTGVPLPLVAGTEFSLFASEEYDCPGTAEPVTGTFHWAVDNPVALDLQARALDDPMCPARDGRCRMVSPGAPGHGRVQVTLEHLTASRTFAVPAPATYHTLHSLAQGDPRCLLAAEGLLYCWGGAVNTPMPPSASGKLGVCRNGGQWCSPTPILAVTQAGLESVDLTPGTGIGHGCGLDQAGQSYCWGYDSYATGNIAPSGVDLASPRLVGGGGTYRKVATGNLFTCALAIEGTVYCWGENRFGQLGIGSHGVSGLPSRVSGSLEFVDVDAGGSTACGVTTTGAVACWGLLTEGTPGAVPCPSGGGKFSTPYCSTVPFLIPAGEGVPAGLAFRRISVGGSHGCLLGDDGSAYCFGSNTRGQLGAGTTLLRSPHPLPVAGGIQFASISAGDSHTCGVAMDAVVWCWGEGGMGQLGSGQRTSTTQPVQVSGAVRFSSISAGTRHTCGIGLDGHAYCWGANLLGALGDASQEDRLAPSRVAGRGQS